MVVVHKYLLEPGRNTLSVPRGAHVLSFGVQNDQLVCWARVEPSLPKTLRGLLVTGTGHELPPEHRHSRFVGTVQVGPFVWHLFEEVGDLD